MDKLRFYVYIEADGTGLDTTHGTSITDILDILHNLHKGEIVDFFDEADITVKRDETA